jgi:hypothetical protein
VPRTTPRHSHRHVNWLTSEHISLDRYCHWVQEVIERGASSIRGGCTAGITVSWFPTQETRHNASIKFLREPAFEGVKACICVLEM